MDMNKYKRDFKYRSDMGNKKGFMWLIIIGGIILVALSLFFDK